MRARSCRDPYGACQPGSAPAARVPDVAKDDGAQRPRYKADRVNTCGGVREQVEGKRAYLVKDGARMTWLPAFVAPNYARMQRHHSGIKLWLQPEPALPGLQLCKSLMATLLLPHACVSTRCPLRAPSK